jgi:hypothetical protein
MLAVMVKAVSMPRREWRDRGDGDPSIPTRDRLLLRASRIAAGLGLLTLPTGVAVFVYQIWVEVDLYTVWRVVMVFMRVAVVLFLSALLLRALAGRFLGPLRMGEGREEEPGAPSGLSRRRMLAGLGLLLVTGVVFLPGLRVSSETDGGGAADQESFWVTATPSIPAGPARDDVIAFVKEHHPEAAPLLESTDAWEPLPEPSVHAFAFHGYRSPTWRMIMTLLYAHLVRVDGKDLEEDTFRIELKYFSPPPYVIWWGNYTQSGGVVETGYNYFETETDRIAPELARDLAYDFIAREHDEMPPFDGVWELVGVDEGLGYVKHDYRAPDGLYAAWRVGVRWDEYTASFRVEARYEYSTYEDYEEIEWGVSVSADGTEIREWEFRAFFGV